MTSPPRARDARALRVRVPGSTSNLGPGFDALGLALALELEVVARPAPGSACELGRLEGSAAGWPAGPQNLLVRAFERARTALDAGAGGWSLAARSAIPLERGLGSSGAAIAAGLLLGSALTGGEVPRETLLEWAVELEGHPDNVAPSLLGGCVLCAPRPGGPPRVVRVPLDDALGFAVAWPDARLPTAFARGLLPREVAREDAVETARALALVLEGLRRGAADLLEAGNDERLHVPYRLPHIPGGAAALAAARASGAYLATISGSGSALFAVCARERAREVAAAMGSAFAAAGAGGAWHALEPVLAAPQVTPA